MIVVRPETEHIQQIVVALGDQAIADIAWAQRLTAPADASQLATTAIWVISNGGMRYRTAQLIFERVMTALADGLEVSSIFRNVRKARAMQTIWDNREELFAQFISANDRLEWCGTLPHIGKITRYHLAKDLGVDCAKPDVHLARIAFRSGESVADMCARLSHATPYRVATIDVILWRACETGLLNSRTGELNRLRMRA